MASHLTSTSGHAVDTEVAAQATPGLRHNAAGLTRVLFISIATVAPAGGAATSVVIATVFAGGATPLAVLLAAVGCVLEAICIGQLARKLPSAGGLYTYVTRSLGTSAGFFTAWGMVFSYVLAPSLYYGFFGLLVVNELKIDVPSFPTLIWVPIGVAAAGGVWYLNYRGLQASTNASVILGTIENAILLALVVTLVVHAGSANTFAVFKPSTGNPSGFGGVLLGAIYAVLAVIGFEAAAPIGEEARSPKRTINRAIVGSAAIVGAIYLVTYYAFAVYFGPHRFSSFSTYGGGSPFPAVANQVWGSLGIFMFFALLNSTFGSCNALTTAVSRMTYALGRARVFPAAFAEVHKEHRTPHVGIAVATGVGLIAAVACGLFTSGPIDTLSLFGTTIALLIILIYILIAIGSAYYYWTKARAEFNWIVHFIVPILAVIFFLAVELATLGIKLPGLAVAPLSGVAEVGLYLAIGWTALGCAYLLFLRTKRQRWKLASLGDTMVETPITETVDAASRAPEQGERERPVRT